MCCKAKRQQRLAAAAALTAQNAQAQQPNLNLIYGEPPSYAVANGQNITQSNGCHGDGYHGRRRRCCGRTGGGQRFSLWSLFARRREHMGVPSRELDFEYEVKNADDGMKGFGKMTKKVDDTSSI